MVQKTLLMLAMRQLRSTPDQQHGGDGHAQLAGQAGQSGGAAQSNADAPASPHGKPMLRLDLGPKTGRVQPQIPWNYQRKHFDGVRRSSLELAEDEARGA